jgi:hypothetical protein
MTAMEKSDQFHRAWRPADPAAVPVYDLNPLRTFISSR